MIIYLVLGEKSEKECVHVNPMGIYLDIEMAFAFKDRCQVSDPSGHYYIMPYVLIETHHTSGAGEFVIDA